ncbi:DUF2993 domain-containing protein [Microbacterium lacus]|uniref:LmeA family phospholipid-binding protein n=1 Tax=Microbacterium lacus TaxID=415217 RepID=UPI0038505875
MSAADTQPTQPLPDWAQAHPVPRRRRTGWGWVVALVIVAALAVGAWFIGEAIARDLVTKTIREQIVSELALPADHPVDVSVPGAILPQLIGGTLDEISIASDDVTIGPMTADITLQATEVPVRGNGEIDGASGTVRIDEEQLRTLMETVDQFPAETLGLDAPNLTMSIELTFFGISIPIAVALTPSAVDGGIVLTPQSLQLAGAEISADALRDRFGAVADIVIRDWPVCVAQYLPAGLSLTGMRVDGEVVVADFDVAQDVLTNPAQLENGSCA